MKTFFHILFSFFCAILASFPIFAAETISEIRVDPSDEADAILESLPFKAKDEFRPNYTTLAERLLQATEKYDLVATNWDSQSQIFEIHVIPKRFFEDVIWAGDRVLESSRIGRQCLYPREYIDLSQERLSQITRCIVGELQGEGYLDASVVLSAQGENLAVDTYLGPLYKVSKIELIGLDSSETREIKRRLLAEEKMPFHPQRIAEDTKLILNDLLRSGYYFVEVFQPVVNVVPATQEVFLQWRINKGKRFLIGFSGDYKSENPLKELLSREEAFPKWFVDEIRDSVLSELRNDGYLDVEVVIDRFEKKDGTEKINFVTKKREGLRFD